MPEVNPITKLQQRLAALGCPPKALRRIALESAEHFDDLQASARTRGLTESEAAASAVAQLGDPQQLAERHIEVLRNSSWFGRYPLLPLLIPVVYRFDSGYRPARWIYGLF